MNTRVRTNWNASLIIACFCLMVFGSGRLAQAIGEPIVRVGSETITQATIDNMRAKHPGTEQDVLTKLVYMSLIRQGAKKAEVWPSTQDVDQQIAAIRRRSPQLLAKVDRNPSLMQEFKDNLRVDIAFENLRIKDVKVTNAQIAAFYSINKQAFALPQQVQTTMVVTDNKADADRAVKFLQSGMRDEVIARQPRMHVAGIAGFHMDMDRLSAADKKTISAAVFTMKSGNIKIISVQTKFLIFKIKKSEGKAVPAFSQVKPIVTRTLKLQKAPSAQYVLATLFQNAKPQFQSSKYEAYFYNIEKIDLKAMAK